MIGDPQQDDRAVTCADVIAFCDAKCVIDYPCPDAEVYRERPVGQGVCVEPK